MIVDGDSECIEIAVRAAAVVVAAVAAAAGSAQIVSGTALGYMAPCLNNNSPTFSIINN